MEFKIKNIHQAREFHSDLIRQAKKIEEAFPDLNQKKDSINPVRSKIERISQQLEIPEEIRNEALKLYDKVASRGLLKGRSRNIMIIATLYLSCKINNFPQTLDDFSRFNHLYRGTLFHYYKIITIELDIKIQYNLPIKLLERYCSELQLSTKVQNRAIEVLELSEENGLIEGQNPIGIAGATIYIAGILEGERRTQEEISYTINITTPTIRKHAKKLWRMINKNANN